MVKGQGQIFSAVKGSSINISVVKILTMVTGGSKGAYVVFFLVPHAYAICTCSLMNQILASVALDILLYQHTKRGSGWTIFHGTCRNVDLNRFLESLPMCLLKSMIK